MREPERRGEGYEIAIGWGGGVGPERGGTSKGVMCGENERALRGGEGGGDVQREELIQFG